MAGTWQAVVNGFGGMRCQKGKLRFKPRLPERWTGCSFCVKYQGCLLEVTFTKETAKFSLLEGEHVCFFLEDKKIELKNGGEFIGKI